MYGRRRPWLLFFVLAAGCNDDTTAPGPPPVSESLTWIGSFTEGGVRGAVSLDLVKTNDVVAGDLVITRVPDLGAPEWLFVTGTMDDSLHLGLDSTRAPYQYTFTLDAAVDASLNLSGIIDYPVAGLHTPVTGWLLPADTVSVLSSFLVPTYVRSMVGDGTFLWLSTLSDDFVRFNSQGVFQDQVVVFYSGDIHWTSSALTYDGTHLLGFLPTVISGPGGTINASRMYEFDASGIQREYVLPHRTAGLAYDGTNYWSLDSNSRQLMRFDASGTISDSVSIDVPDPHHLEFDGQFFWTMSWYTQRLFKVGTDGKAVAVFDVPRTNPGQVATSIAVEGSHIWYSEQVDLESTRIYSLQPE